MYDICMRMCTNRMHVQYISILIKTSCTINDSVLLTVSLENIKNDLAHQQSQCISFAKHIQEIQ